jgi:hypothetical protein
MANCIYPLSAKARLKIYILKLFSKLKMDIVIEWIPFSELQPLPKLSVLHLPCLAHLQKDKQSMLLKIAA